MLGILHIWVSHTLKNYPSSCKILECPAGYPCRLKPVCLKLQTKLIFHIKHKKFLQAFNMQQIFKVYHYYVNQGNTVFFVLYRISSRVCFHVGKLTSLTAKALVASESLIQHTCFSVCSKLLYSPGSTGCLLQSCSNAYILRYNLEPEVFNLLTHQDRPFCVPAIVYSAAMNINR